MSGLRGTSRRVELPWRGPDRRGGPIVVREAVRRDAARLLEHMEAILAETEFMLQGPDDYLPVLEEEREILERVRRLSNCLAVVAVRPRGGPGRDAILANLTLFGGQSSRTRHVAHLGMGVLRESWGLGLGALVLDAGLTWARATPMLRRVTLQVYETNDVARRLYLSRGFEEEGVLRREVRLDRPREGRSFEGLVGMSLDVRSARSA